jgi:hypothetical protein
MRRKRTRWNAVEEIAARLAIVPFGAIAAWAVREHALSISMATVYVLAIIAAYFFLG